MVGYGHQPTPRGRPPPPATRPTPRRPRATRTSADTDNNAADFTRRGTPGAADTGATPPPVDPPDRRRHDHRRDPGHRRRQPARRARRSAPGASSPRRTRRAASTASTSRPAGRGHRPRAPPTRVFVYGGPASRRTPTVGDSVEVTGRSASSAALTEVDADHGRPTSRRSLARVPDDRVPGTDCALPARLPDRAALDAARGAEGELFQPTAPFTVTDGYDFGVTSSNFFGEIGLAAGIDIPLVAPTEVVDAQDTAGIAARTAYNDAHRVVLDDGVDASTTGTPRTTPPARTSRSRGSPRTTRARRCGGHVRQAGDPRLPLQRLEAPAPAAGRRRRRPVAVTFEQDRPAAPADVGGDLKLATLQRAELLHHDR